MRDTILDQYDRMITGMWALERLGCGEVARPHVAALHDQIAERLGKPTDDDAECSDTASTPPITSDDLAFLDRVGIAYRRFVAAETFFIAEHKEEYALTLIEESLAGFIAEANAFLRLRHRRRRNAAHERGYKYYPDEFVPIGPDALLPPLDTSAAHHRQYGLETMESILASSSTEPCGEANVHQ